MVTVNLYLHIKLCPPKIKWKVVAAGGCGPQQVRAHGHRHAKIHLPRRRIVKMFKIRFKF